MLAQSQQKRHTTKITTQSYHALFKNHHLWRCAAYVQQRGSVGSGQIFRTQVLSAAEGVSETQSSGTQPQHGKPGSLPEDQDHSSL